MVITVDWNNMSGRVQATVTDKLYTKYNSIDKSQRSTFMTIILTRAFADHELMSQFDIENIIDIPVINKTVPHSNKQTVQVEKAVEQTPASSHGVKVHYDDI